MHYVARKVGNVMVLELRGPLTSYDAPVLTNRVDEVIRDGCSKVVVLMGAVTCTEQAGLDAIVSARALLLRQGGDLKLVMPPQYLVERVGMWFGSWSSETEAILSFWPRSSGRHARLVGCWAVDDEVSKYPNPKHLVNPEWNRADRGSIVEYLRSGNPQSGDVEPSHCRFGCESCASNELTDGAWIWPESLAHYVEAHSIMLPDAFLSAMAVNRWSAPRRFAEGPPNVGFWVEWASHERLTPSPFADCLAASRRIEVMLDEANLETLMALDFDESTRMQRLLEMARTVEAPSALLAPAEVQAVLLDAEPSLLKLNAERSSRASSVSVFTPRAS